MPSRDRWRTATRALAAVSVAAVVALVVTLRDAPGPDTARAADPWAGWQTVRGDGAAYRVPPDWGVGPPEQEVSYRDAAGRPQARGAALTTYDRNDCPGGARHPGAWAVLAEPVRARDPAAVAAAAARQWARGFGAGPRGVAPASEPRLGRLDLADGRPATTASVSLDLAGLGNPCGQRAAELTVVAVRDGPVVRLLVVGRHPDVLGAVSDSRVGQILRSLT